jgi:hypothetical protein
MADRIYDRPANLPTPVELIRELTNGFSPELGGLNEGAPEEVLRYVEERLEEELKRVRAVRAWYYGAIHPE